MSKKLWIRLALCYYTLGIAYHQLRDSFNAKSEIIKAQNLMQGKAAGGIAENVLRHVENIIKFGIYRT